MRFFGGQPVDMGNAGAIQAQSNLFAGGNFLGGQGSAINPEAFKKDARQQKIYNKGMGTDNPNEKEIFLRRTGPQLPMANFPGVFGNMGGLVAQAQTPGGALGASALGGGVSMNMEQMQRQMQEMQQQGGPPIRFGVDIENEKIKNLRGSVNANLDENQAIRFGGNYNVMRTPGLPNAVPGYGVQWNVMSRF
jgi:CubicO group peptidase (beta-lactamase class C family)